VLQLADLRSRLGELGLEPVGNSPEDFDAYIRSEIGNWGAMVKAIGLKADSRSPPGPSRYSSLATR
jgi:tripartite-type tricarboxylate transporter receptor subunit TctC